MLYYLKGCLLRKVYVHKVHTWVARRAGIGTRLIFEFVGLLPLALNIVALKCKKYAKFRNCKISNNMLERFMVDDDLIFGYVSKC